MTRLFSKQTQQRGISSGFISQEGRRSMFPAFQKWQDLLLQHVKSQCQLRAKKQPKGEESHIG